MLFLSDARASAFVTLPISAVDLPGRTLRHWPELGVATKNGERATTFLLPIPELLTIAQAWDDLVFSNLPSDAPWYAPVSARWGSQSLEESEPGKNRHQALDKRLRKLFDLAGLPYKSAHKFRHGHAVYGLQHAQRMADYKAVSMNLIHEDIKITMEIIVKPLALGRQDIARKYEALLVNFPNLDIVDLDRNIIRQAARLRAEYRVRPPDALQASVSLLYGVEEFITNDGLLKRLQDKLEVIVLDDFIDET